MNVPLEHIRDGYAVSSGPSTWAKASSTFKSDQDWRSNILKSPGPGTHYEKNESGKGNWLGDTNFRLAALANNFTQRS
jgi:hypothetical protein